MTTPAMAAISAHPPSPLLRSCRTLEPGSVWLGVIVTTVVVGVGSAPEARSWMRAMSMGGPPGWSDRLQQYYSIFHAVLVFLHAHRSSHRCGRRPVLPRRARPWPLDARRPRPARF